MRDGWARINPAGLPTALTVVDTLNVCKHAGIRFGLDIIFIYIGFSFDRLRCHFLTALLV